MPGKISAGEAFVSVSVKNDNLISGLKQASEQIRATARDFSAQNAALSPNLSISGSDAFRASLREVRREAEQTANAAKKLSDRFVITAGDIYHAFRGVASTLGNLLGGMGDQFDKMAARTGVSVGALSEYAHAAKICGASIGDVEGALRSMATQLVAAQNGSARARKSFEILGLNIDEIAGKSPEKQFDQIARAISSIADPTERAGAAMKIFGAAGASLLPLFSEGPDGLQKLREEARRLGVSIDAETAKIGAEFTDATTRLKSAFSGVGISLSKLLTPALIEASNSVARIVSAITGFVENNPILTKSIGGVVAGIAGLTSAIFVGTKAFAGISTAAATLGRVLAGLKAAILVNPWLALAGAIAAAVAAVAAYRAAVSGVPKFSDSAKTALDEGEAAREQDRANLERLKTLEQISQKQQLSNGEIAEAARLAEQLRQKYGDVGISVDTVTGKIKGASAAQAELNERMNENRKRELAAAIKEAQTNIDTGALDLEMAKNRVSDWDAIIGKKYGQTWKDYFTSWDRYDTTDELKLAMVKDDPKFQARLNASKEKTRAQIASWQAELDALSQTAVRSTVDAIQETATGATVTESDAVADFIKKGTEEEKSALDQRIDAIKDRRNRLIAELRKLADPNGEVDWNDSNAVDALFRTNPNAAAYQRQALAVDASANAQIQREQDKARQQAEAERIRQAEIERQAEAERQRKQQEGDKALAEAERKRFEKFASPLERLALAEQDLQQAMNDLTAAQQTGDSATIAAALNRLGETEDKYQNVSDAVADMAANVGRSVGGTFNAWQAATVASVDYDKQTLIEQRTQTGYLRQIVSNTRRGNAAVFA